MVNMPTVDSGDYELQEDSAVATPKHGTSVQSGWDAADKLLTSKKKYGDDFKPSETAQLVRFLEDGPFHTYELHWLTRESGKRSFVSLGEDDPLTTIAKSIPRPRFAFNILNLSAETPVVEVLTAPPTLMRQLREANSDPRRGPLTKYYWAISRSGTGKDTLYTLERVKSEDLASEWGFDPAVAEEAATSAVCYDASSIYVASREEHVEVAREIAARMTD
jgi:hypothetical protein